ncbi:ABC transporter permease [Herbiconiux sp. CPCC 205763]|uniref:ABC transporter permease n=1 Tax=Herbiconiux aconitum TaxID=2970913 RepID=A0ABT2GKC8_9MICO|nr:ABC transporter permease [Herbiconiux aconitum]MCS5716684.1 ABC transporter permease [Herbiconiux aconitum]
MSDSPENKPVTPPEAPSPAAGTAATGTAATTATPTAVEPPSRWRATFNEIIGGSVMISILAVVLAIVAGGILIAVTDENVQKAAGYFFARPGDTFAEIWKAVSGAYVALFQGSIYNFKRPDFLDQIKPLTETLTFATPLIAAGLGVGLAFRVGMFNIGGRGQMLIAAACAGWVGFTLHLPFGIHLIVAILAGVIGGGIWGGIAGLLKARTGAHEVIVTIMLNYVAFYLVSYLLRTPVLQAPGSNNPKSPPIDPTAVLPDILGPKFNLHLGFILVIAVTVFVWWLLNRSALGFKFRAVGINPNAARVAGIDVKNMYVYAMLISGGLVGLAGVFQVLGTVTTGFSSGIDAGIGFDAITVALLGRSKPWGIFIAGILFGAFKAGGFAMQASQGIPIDIVVVVQSLIVLFIAAPPLIRTVFRLPDPSKPKKPKPPKAVPTATREAVAAK